MYSLVLMTAMTAAPDAAGEGFFRNLFHRNGCDSSCYGCGARYSCSGCSGCTGYTASASCGGCCGSGGFLGLGLFRRSSAGCCGGCSGASYSCSGYACGGSVAYAGYSSPAISYTPVFNGGLTCYGGPVPSAPPPVYGPAPTIPYADPQVAPPPALDPNRTGFRPAGYEAPARTTAAGGPTARGTVLIRLPADARLFADNTALRMTGPERTFVTPELATEMEYTYRFRAEYERDGETISVTKRVAVRPGQKVAVEFTDLVARGGGNQPTGTTVSNPTPTTSPAALPVPPVAPPAAPAAKPDAVAPAPPANDRATITVKLPPGATLYVDSSKSPAAGPVREFSTPPLPTGREFAYLMKAEMVRDGRPEYLIQKVSFRAGDRITVDFTAGMGR